MEFIDECSLLSGSLVCFMWSICFAFLLVFFFLLENEKWWKANQGKAITRTSDVNVNATDNQGWTAVHHTVCPLDVGTFDNQEILSVLANCEADIQKKDHAGLSPLDHALIRGACKLAALLQKLSGVEEDKMVNIIYF